MSDAGMFDRQSAARIAEATRYVESMLRNDASQSPRRNQSSTGASFVMGYPATAFTAGTLTAPDNLFSVRKGPAHADPTTEVREIEVHYSFADVETTQLCTATRYYGKWYVMPLECPEPEPEEPEP